jgi:hypothetical protein
VIIGGVQGAAGGVIYAREGHEAHGGDRGERGGQERDPAHLILV